MSFKTEAENQLEEVSGKVSQEGILTGVTSL